MSTLLAWRLAMVLLGSFFVCATIIATQRWHGRLSLDHDLNGAQKLHAAPVPRIGGLGLLGGLIIAVISGYFIQNANYQATLLLLVSAMPVFLSGLLEDLTKNVRIRTRLITSFFSAGLAIWLLNARILEVNTPLLDTILSYPVVSILFTIFAVGGVTHSINIIDGLNGLAAGVTSIILIGLASLAWIHGDLFVMKLCFWGLAATIGFLLLNYPFGRIFLGDGGAYLAGFWVAECSVLLLSRNPDISTWAVLLACFYPVWETVFSMYRRHVVQRVNSGQADLAHLHQLLYQGMKVNGRTQIGRYTWIKHGLVSALIWGIVVACQIFSVTFSNNTTILFCGVSFFAFLYCCLYQSLAPDVNQRHGHIHATKP